ncbi:D-arabinono-1,4-lactone oxidase [Simiduia litorea]|uniref:D-arabinono-1,4-lactone oxidase n=1 Tax=Simiduia litorea TaxID=1435348 RepID=UPI0036F305D1
MKPVKRRSLLTQLVQLATLSALPMPLIAASRPIPWRNWSGSQTCLPQQRFAPASVAELQTLVKTAAGTVRPVGSGHSFSALVPTDDTLVSLSRLKGVLSTEGDRATIAGGTRLGDLGDALASANQALINMPDIDEQSLAGALATATHGTGAHIGCLSSFITDLQLVCANGELLRCNANANTELFNAARVNLGALGIVTELTLANVKPYKLKRETEWLKIEDILEKVENLAEQNRNVEFYYIPFSGMGFTDVHNITDDPVSSTEKIDQNDGAETLKDIRDWLGFSPKIRELVLSSYMKTIDKEISIAASWENYTLERNVRFNEMEYHLPRSEGLKAVAEIRQVLEKNFSEVFFPIEVRFVKGDDIWLSPFYQRDTISIAVHRYFNEDYRPYFAAIEPIFKKYGGRPHWGKINTLNGKDFKALYPNWQNFLAVRKAVDPHNKFLNPYLHQLFG